MKKTKVIIDGETGEVSEPEESTELIQAEPNGIVSLTTAMTSKDLKAAVKLMTEQRKIIKDFIQENLVDGVDYGVIDAVSKSGKAFKSKPTLYKPGMEKILSLFGLASELEKDVTTLEMLTNIPNLIAYKCTITRGGQKIAEGRGAAVVGDMSRDVNATIKIAEKRARMDACLSLGFSEYFTQDMDDPEYSKSNKPVTHFQPPTMAVSGAVSDKQRKAIFGLLKRFNIVDKEKMKETLKLNGFPESTKDMDSETANKLITLLYSGDFVRPEEAAPAKADVIVEPDENFDPEAAIESVAEPEPEGETADTFLATGEIKEGIITKLDSLGLGAKYRLRIIKDVSGKLATNKFTDSDWFSLDVKLEQILSGDEELPSEWLKGE
jgi:hypothetical protein